MSPPPPPQVPQFELVRQIGRGSYGEVWLARTITGVYRAVKIVWRGPADDMTQYHREFGGIKDFQSISSSVAGFVEIHHVGIDESAGFFYYVMELADDASGAKGLNPDSYQPKTLRSVMRGAGRLPVAACLQIGIAIASALEDLHDRGLVHRDIKPSNILFIDGMARLGDVGLVASGGDDRSLVGTDGYLPPEPRYIGKIEGDLYALGKVLYEISSGKDRAQFPEFPTGLPAFHDRLQYRSLNDVFLAACDNDPHRRFTTASSFRKALENIAAGKPPELPRPPSNILRTATVAGLAAAAFFTITIAIWPEPVELVPLHQVRRQPTSSSTSPWKIFDFNPPGIIDWSDPHFVDFDGDGARDIVTLQDKTLYVISDKAEILGNSRELPPEAHISLVTGADASGQARIFVGWAQVSNLVLAAYNQNLKPLQSFRFTGATGMDEAVRKLTSASSLRALGYDAENGNLYANILTGHEGNPRGLICFNARTREQRWLFATAPTVSTMILKKMAETDGVRVVIGSAAVWNGHSLTNGTDDSHSYAWGLDSDGNEKWKFEAGGIYVASHPFEASPPLPREFYLFASVGPDFPEDSGPESGTVWRLTIDGRPSRRRDGTIMKYSVGHQLMNWLAASNRIPAVPEVFLADRLGNLHVLDSELNLKEIVPVTTNRFDSAETYVDAVTDLDGDGSSEIILHSMQKRNVSGRNPGRVDGEPNVRVYYDKTIWILDSELRPVGSYQVSSESKRGELRVEILPRAGGRGVNLLALTDRALLLRWRR